MTDRTCIRVLDDMEAERVARLPPEPYLRGYLLSYGQELGVLEPKLNYYPRQREPIGTPDVRPGVTEDLYLSLLSVAPDNSWASLRVMRTPFVSWIWIGTLIMAFGTLIALWPSAKRKRAAAPAAEGARA